MHFETKFQRQIQNWFTSAFGSERVKLVDIGLKLTFNLSDPVQLEEFNLLGKMVSDLRLEHTRTLGAGITDEVFMDYVTQTAREENVTMVTIPHEAANRVFAKVAHQMFKHSEMKRQGALLRPVIKGDREEMIPETTNQEWNFVTGGRYDNHTLQTAYPPSSRQQRDKEVIALGEALLPGNLSSRVEIRDWVAHLAEADAVPGMHKSPERELVLPAGETAIPESWTGLSKLHRLHDPENRIKLETTFKR